MYPFIVAVFTVTGNRVENLEITTILPPCNYVYSYRRNYCTIIIYIHVLYCYPLFYVLGFPFAFRAQAYFSSYIFLGNKLIFIEHILFLLYGQMSNFKCSILIITIANTCNTNWLKNTENGLLSDWLLVSEQIKIEREK